MITRVYDKSTDMTGLYYKVDGKIVSELHYTKCPNIVYTQDKDTTQFIYIEEMRTKVEHRKKGYSTSLVQELKRLYPHKIILASPGEYSENLLRREGVIDADIIP